jgi:hypothetical protein
MTTRHLLPLTHVLLTLSVTDETRTPIGPIVDAHLNSVTEVYPPDHDPVWITPRTRTDRARSEGPAAPRRPVRGVDDGPPPWPRD